MTDLSQASESPPIIFDLTESDMRVLMTMSAQRSYRLDQPSVPPPTRRWASLIVVLCFGLLFLVLLNVGSWSLPAWFFLVPLLVGSGAASKLVDNRAARRKAADAWVDQIMQSSLTAARLGRYSVRVTAAGVEHSSPLESRQIRWPGIHCFTAHNNFVFVSLGWDVLSIPAHACAGVGGAQALADFGNRRLAEEGVGILQTMVGYLAAHSVKCRHCRYNLRGVTKLVCPECGKPIEADHLPGAWKRR